MRVGAALAFTVIAGCMSSAGGGGGNSGPSTLSVAITSGTCPNGVLTVKGTATGSQGTAFFVDDGITDLANSVCAPWYTIQGGCNRGDSGSDTTMWTATQAEDLSTGPRTFTVTVKKVIDDVNSGIVQTKVTCGGSGGAGGGGGGGGGGSCTQANATQWCCGDPNASHICSGCNGPCGATCPMQCPGGGSCFYGCSIGP